MILGSKFMSVVMVRKLQQFYQNETCVLTNNNSIDFMEDHTDRMY